MEGQKVSHYTVLERLGGGGMGVVYKALDTKLNRPVALKFLPRELTRDDEARQRFVQEAQAASALDHPNICTIHEVDSTDDGQMFIAMAFYDGQTLKKRIQQGPLPVEEAIDIAQQIARGLLKAHAAGIIHRDVKPANLMITEDGLVKILDFGVAKLLGVTGLTRTGSSPGTVFYMSPEQLVGEDADQQSDVWALGVVLYEMLAGRLPFGGENHWAVINAVTNQEPDPLTATREDIPDELDRIVLRSLKKTRKERIPTVSAFLGALTELQAQLAGAGALSAPEAGPPFVAWRPRITVSVTVAVLALGILALLSLSRSAEARWAREEALPEIARLIEGNELRDAFELAAEARRFIPNDPVLTELEPTFSSAYSVSTTPSGADIYARAYAATDGEWEYLGRSPVTRALLPRGAYRWRIEHEGFEPVSMATPIQTVALDVSLPEAAADAEMVFVPAGGGPVPLTTFSLEGVQLGAFYIDTYEVTNEQYKEFVDAGGYENREFWVDQQFRRDGRELSWEEAVADFVDTTGRPGPATWELGDYPDGEGDYPVGGVSWHEAAAYARFRGKHLPTAYHWSRGALPAGEIVNPLGPEIAPLSNFNGAGAAPVGRYPGMGPYGTLDMAGNVREWVWNATGDNRLILGGAWSDPEYMFSLPYELPPFDRSPLNGFRTVRYADGGEPPEDLAQPVTMERNASTLTAPITADVFEAYRRQFSYASSPLNANVDVTPLPSDDWIRERITLDAAYGGERVLAYLFLPKNGNPPYQTIVHFPGVGAFNARGSSENLRVGEGTITSQWVMGAIVKTGRAVLWPVYKGSYERFTARREAFTGEERLIFHREQRIQWYQDLARLLDYLETRDDIDEDRIGFLGASYGASAALPLLALEDRLQVAILMSGGTPYEQLPPEVNPVHYLPRTTIPLLMLNGRYDYIFPVESNQNPLFDLLGTPAQHKRRVLYEAGHSPLPRGPAIREAIDWLDEYLGSVN